MSIVGKYNKLTDRYPTTTAAAQGLGLGIAAKYGSKMLLPMMLSPLLAKLPGGMGNQALNKLTPEQVNRLSNIIGGIVGAGEFGRATLARERGLHNLIFGDEQELKKGNYKAPAVNPLTGELPALSKTGADNSWDFGAAGFDREIIPTKDMISTINKDKYMDPFQKLQTNTILYNADKERRGLISGREVAKTAIRAGLGFMPGYALGKTLTSLAGLPSPVRNRMAHLGGVGGALFNTGVLEI